jgi:D-glycero-D-manno-heptose 1,7-bisphosphate phosphatase
MVDKRPALFLDRDGVINIDHGYVCKPENFDFIEGIFELVANANAFGYLVIVVTNQAGIGRGYYTEADFHELTSWMRAQFAARGAHIDAVYFCPDHPEHGVGSYRRETVFRKPGPGMLLKATDELGIDLHRSVLVGDKDSDIKAGAAAGVGCLIFYDQVERHISARSISRLQEVLPFLKKNDSIRN